VSGENARSDEGSELHLTERRRLPASRRRIIAWLLLITVASASWLRGRQGKQPGEANPDPLTSNKGPKHEILSFEELERRATEAREGDRVSEAIALYQRGVRERPTWSEGWWYLGTLLYETDRYAEARDAFQRLVSIRREGGAAWALLGLCEFQLRDYERAFHDLQRGRTLGLGSNKELIRVTRYHAALLMTRFEQFEAALQILYSMAREEGDSPVLREALGIATLCLPLLPFEVPPEKQELVGQAGKAAYYEAIWLAADARREFEELVKRFPNTPNVHYSLGAFLVKSNVQAAMTEFHREIEISPSNVRARLQIAFEYLKEGKSEAALPYAERSTELAPGSFAAHNALGRILLQLGQKEKAVKELEEAVRLAPDSPECHYALSRAYARLGRKQEADRERAEFVRLKKLQEEILHPQKRGTSEPQPDERPPI
jgi:tetratricopeptide (TPR) repeat protein